MNLDLTEEERGIQEAARKFAEAEVAPRSRDCDREERFPQELVPTLARLGFLAPTLPERYGGAAMSDLSYLLLVEEIGRVDSSIRSLVTVHAGLVASSLLKWGTEAQRDRWLPQLARGERLGAFALSEPGAGSDAASLKTQAVPDGKGWRLKGEKTWISNGGVAGLYLVFAKTDPSRGSKGITCFLVERPSPGFTVREIKGKLGLRASSTAQLFFDETPVGPETVLGSPGEGLKVALSALDGGRVSVAAGCVGICQGALDASVRYARERRQFDRPIGSFQLVQDMIAQMAVDTDAGRLLTWRAGMLKSKGERFTREASMAKLYASEAAVRVASQAVQIHGAYGYVDEYPVGRYFRDAKVTTIYEGTSQIHKLILGGIALGLKAFS